MVDRHDDELAERRASGARPRRERGPGSGPAAAGTLGGALPLQWDDPAPDTGVGEDDLLEEADGDGATGTGNGPGDVLEMGTTIDLTGRSRGGDGGRGRGDDLDVWSDVLRRRPVEAARLTGHPSAAGERIAAAQAAAVNPRRRAPGGAEAGEGPDPAVGGSAPSAGRVSRLRPVPPEPGEPSPAKASRPRGSGSELATRVVTGAAMAAFGLLVLNAGPGPTSLLVSVIVALGVIELCGALRTQGYRPAGLIALLGSVGLVLGGYHSGEPAFAAVVALVAPATLLWYLGGVSRARPAPGVASTFLAFGYVGIMGGFAGLILGRPNGIGLILGVVLCSVAYDIAGYLAGSRFGRRHIAPHISPNKTVEGLLAGMLGSVVVGLVLVGGISPWGRFDALALGVVVAVLAPLGDLCESLLKRDLGVKDLGGLLPGHGGLLDRFDATLFALPAVYYLIKLLDVA